MVTDLLFVQPRVPIHHQHEGVVHSPDAPTAFAVQQDETAANRIDLVGRVIRSVEAKRHQFEDSEDVRATSRQSGLPDINWGMTIFANTLKFVSAIMTVLGGDSTERADGIDEAVGALLTIGGSLLRHFSDFLLNYNPQTTFESKLGVAAGTDDLEIELSEEEKLIQKQVLEYVATLTPDQIFEQQMIVAQHVEKEATEKNMSEEEALKLLATTLKANGLPPLDVQAGPPPPGSQPIPGFDQGLPNPLELPGALASTLSGAAGSVLQLLGGSQPEDKQEQVQNNIISGESPPPQGNIAQEIATDILYLPLHVGLFLEHVYGNLVGNQPETKLTENSDPASSLPIPQLEKGVDPGVAAITLVGTGLLGTMLGLATTTPALKRRAQGAFEAIKRNDFVSAATKAVFGALNQHENEIEDYGNQIYYSPDYLQGGYGESNSGYGDYYPYGVDPRDKYYARRNELTGGDVVTASNLDDWYNSYNQDENFKLPENVKFYEPETTKKKSPDTVSYAAEHNPWLYLNSGSPTDHLYKK